MTNLPNKYQWLSKEGAPRMIVEALKLYGTLEAPGSKSNPTIVGWAKEVGLTDTYSTDSIPWCGLFMAVIAKRADKKIPSMPLRALSWANFGIDTPVAMLGDVLTFTRKGGGHVGLYVGEDDTCFHILGGNQSDKVTITRIAKTRLYKIRRPIYAIGQPLNVRKIILSSDGAISTDES